MNKKLIERYYDVCSDFNDSLSLIAILLIINKKSELSFPDLKTLLNELEFEEDIVNHIEDLTLSIKSEDMGRLIRLISPIDKLFVRERPRDVPSVITKGREKFKTKSIRLIKCPKSKKITIGLFGDTL